VAQHRARYDDNAAASCVDPPAEVDLAAVLRELRVHTAKGVPDVASDERAGDTDCKDFVGVVALTLVGLTTVDTGVEVSGGIDRQPGLQQQRAVPIEHLGSREPYRR
jgi:hypothetical protein